MLALKLKEDQGDFRSPGAGVTADVSEVTKGWRRFLVPSV